MVVGLMLWGLTLAFAIRFWRRHPALLTRPWLVPAWAVLSVWLKGYAVTCAVVQDGMIGAGHWFWTLLLLAAVLPGTCLLGRWLGRFLGPGWGRLGDLGCWLSAGLGSLLLWGDLLYYRVFGDFLSVTGILGLCQSQHQGPPGVAWQQFLAWSRLPDLGLIIDLAFMLPAACRARVLVTRPVWLRWLAFGAGIGLFSLFVLAADSTQMARKRVYNRWHVDRYGLPLYHLYDLYFFFNPSRIRPQWVPDSVIRERLALSAASLGPSFPYYARAADHNLVVIQLESFQSFLIDLTIDGQEVTPFLNRLYRRSLSGQALIQVHHGTTSDAQFLLLNSLLPPSPGPLCFLYPQRRYRGLPEILAERGWTTIHTMGCTSSFWNTRIMSQRYGIGETYDFQPVQEAEKIGWGWSDEALLARTLALLSRQKSRFFCHVTTTMMHYPFRELKGSDPGFNPLPGTMMGDYLRLARLRDRSLESFMQKLGQTEYGKKTVVVFCGDHQSRMDESQLSLLGLPRSRVLHHRVPLIIHVPGGPAAQLPPGLSQIDLAPTLLHLLGIKDAPRAFLGRNALAGAHASSTPGGFITDEQVLLWPGVNSGHQFLRMPEEKNLSLDDPRIAPLLQQFHEEQGISDTLIHRDRIAEFAGLP